MRKLTAKNTMVHTALVILNDVSTLEAVEIRETGEVSVLKKERKPKTHLKAKEKRAIEEVWKETKVGARLLYYELRRIDFIPSRRNNLQTKER